jgi:dihydroorotate dehydrogenase electron transfer subunit
MTNPLHAAYYADTSLQRPVPIHENERIASDIWRVRFSCADIANRIVPGQFLMARLHGVNDPLIGRPLAVYDIAPGASGPTEMIDLVYHVKGKFTSQLACATPGQLLDIWGPLGNGFPTLPCQHLVMVAGGIGQTPFLTLAKEHLGIAQYGNPARTAPKLDRVTLCYGAASAEFLAGVDDFRQLGIEIRLATEDGSEGRKGLVTDELEQLLRQEASRPGQIQIVCCGPSAMMRATAELAARYQLPCLVSLETPMACGIGVCFTCVAEVRDENGTPDYKRTCVEGPIFDAQRIAW